MSSPEPSAFGQVMTAPVAVLEGPFATSHLHRPVPPKALLRVFPLGAPNVLPCVMEARGQTSASVASTNPVLPGVQALEHAVHDPEFK